MRKIISIALTLAVLAYLVNLGKTVDPKYQTAALLFIGLMTLNPVHYFIRYRAFRTGVPGNLMSSCAVVAMLLYYTFDYLPASIAWVAKGLSFNLLPVVVIQGVAWFLVGSAVLYLFLAPLVALVELCAGEKDSQPPAAGASQ